MHGWETRMLLKYYLERGVSKAELSRRFGVSRRTIHEWVETGQLDRDLSSGGSRYAPRPPAPHKLDPYTGIIDARLEEYPGLSAQRLFDEVRAAGYPGGYSRVRDYVRAVRPREPTESVVRFETPAGRHYGESRVMLSLTAAKEIGRVFSPRRGHLALHIIPTGTRAIRGGRGRAGEALARFGPGCRHAPRRRVSSRGHSGRRPRWTSRRHGPGSP